MSSHAIPHHPMPSHAQIQQKQWVGNYDAKSPLAVIRVIL